MTIPPLTFVEQLEILLTFDSPIAGAELRERFYRIVTEKRGWLAAQRLRDAVEIAEAA